MPVSKILNLLFPSQCPVCSGKSDSSQHNPICTTCWNAIKKYSGPACRVCGMPTVSAHTTLCEACLKAKPPFSKVLYYGIYEGVLKEAIHLLKFKGIKRLSRSLSLLLAELALPKTDGIVPVPLHPRRLKEREFNQTATISRSLSKKIKTPLLLNVLKKTKDTQPQTDVTGSERLKNVKDAYFVTGEIAGMDLLLVDDVITTGATIRECSKALKKAGAKNITVIALARSMPKHLT